MPTVVQAVSAQALSAATSVTTASITTTGGNLLIAASGTFDSASTMGAPTDSKSNTWTNIHASIVVATNTVGRLERAKSITGGSGHTFTGNGSTANGFPTIAVSEIQSYNSSTPEDGSAQGVGVGAEASPHVTPNVTTAAISELIIGVLVNSNGTTITGTSGTTLDSAVSSGSGTPMGIGHKAAATITTYSCEFSSDTADVVKFTVAIQAAAAATSAVVTYGYGSN